jgi:hypothetical protein
MSPYLHPLENNQSVALSIGQRRRREEVRMFAKTHSWKKTKQTTLK